jgi:hypothetical protein
MLLTDKTMESPIITLKGYPKKNVTLQLFFQGTYSIHICMNKVFKKLFFKDCTFKFLMTSYDNNDNLFHKHLPTKF